MNSLEVLEQLLEHRETVLKLPTPMPLYAVAVLPAKLSSATRGIEASWGPKVNFQHCIYREDCTEPASSYIIKSQSAGTRTIVNYNELPEMSTEEFIQIADSMPTAPKWFHFEGRIPDVTLQCIRYVRKLGPEHKISVEVEKPNRVGLQELAAEADVVFYSKSWAQGNGFQSPQTFLQAQSSLTPQSSILCCTWGEQGAVGLDKRKMAYVHSPASVDATLPIVEYVRTSSLSSSTEQSATY
ncbi:conserved hypothetical protein [Uncinocarpus reesii 1704]|uniref:Uncharacterized protein n=1 Tax=Uncinocarpus reesii (strain UAMH 1704) TaxID=336963 RepID=C4JXB2_UNCRE|nr:uncharacterized protein UREG_06285 [Uncinocarpus reesii 1704]EEP81420.1 conserved hypothetical protein [Uncinocarpus reesii 1704]